MKEYENDSGLKSEIIAGRNAVNEALSSGTEIDKLFVTGSISGSALAIAAKCREKGIPVKQVSPIKLDAMCGGVSHQGIAASVAAYKYSTVELILNRAKEKNEPLFIVICDEIEDPHNLGAIIRTAEGAGAHGIVIGKRRCASLTLTVAKTSAGALMHIPVARVSNIAALIDDLKKRDVWIYGADMSGKSCYETDFSGNTALVIGSEGFGIGRLIKEKCDFLVSLPMKGKLNSLNASVAGGILMYEIAKQRAKI